jgi:heme-degrading monooxygenase HmoA
MFVVLYRWRIKAELEAQFIAAWSEITAYYSENKYWRGSRLHRGADGIFYSYAQWESDELRRKAFEKRPDLTAGTRMREAIEESFPEVVLEIVADYMIFSEKK